MGLASISKAIGAAVGGAAAGAGINFAVLPQVIPEGVDAPWWGYVLIYVICIAIPAIITYYAPRNAD